MSTADEVSPIEAEEKVGLVSETHRTTAILMPQDKEKNYSLFKKITMKSKSTSLKTYVLVLVIFIFSYLAISRMRSGAIAGDSSEVFKKLIMDTGDRAANFNVKVLPSNLSDEDLNALPKEKFSYLTMIDAGSSGCRAHVYKYGKLDSLGGALYILPQHLSKKVKPGLSTFAGNPQDAGKYLADLIEFIKEQVPEEDWAVTPIWLKATAGLRMLDTKVSDQILTSVRSYLGTKSSSPFLFRPSWASVISGQEEGGCGWIAYNYLKRVIGPKKPDNPDHPYAVVEMGGASAQVTQQAPTAADAAQIPKEYLFSFTIENQEYNLYTHSYLGFGAEQAREQLNKRLAAPANGFLSEKDVAGVSTIRDPCLQAGFSRPSSKPRADVYEGPLGSYFNISGVASASPQGGNCLDAIKPIFDSSDKKTECGGTPSPYSFHCTHQPAFVTGSSNFLVFENFYYASSGLGVMSSDSKVPEASKPQFVDGVLVTTPENILHAAEKYCSLTWQQAQERYPLDQQSKDTNTKMCFVGTYAYSLLVNGLGVDAHKTIHVQKDVGPSEIEWALGAAYKEAANFLKRTNLRPT